MNRREFAKVLGVTTLVGTCFEGVNLAGLAQEAVRAGKQLLTEGNLNSFLASKEAPALLSKARGDLKGFIANHFQLTPAQKERLEWFTSDEWQTLESAAQAVTKGRRLRVIIPVGNGPTYPTPPRELSELKKRPHVLIVQQTSPKGGETDAPAARIAPVGDITINVSNMWNKNSTQKSQ